jgi:hypothetical protein
MTTRSSRHSPPSKAAQTDRLKPDAHNARLHPDRNQALIRESLTEVGPFRSIAVDANNIIRAGNGVYEQAQALGLKVRIVDAQPDELIAVRRKDLKGRKAERAALYDNRAGELAEWNADVIRELRDHDARMLAGIFTDEELRAAFAKLPGGASPSDVEFKQYDEDVEREVQFVECPKCGHKFAK